jgi:hypothetical protein
MKFTNILILLLGIFFIGFPQGAIAEKNHVPGKPFADLQEQIDDLQEQIDNITSAPEQQGAPGPAEPRGSAGILEKYTKVIEVLPYYSSDRFIVYCDNIPDDTAISGNAYTYWDMGDSLQYSPYSDVLRPVCTDYGEGNPGPGLETMTCQQGELPIGWQFIQHPYNKRSFTHVVLNVMCIYAQDTQ